MPKRKLNVDGIVPENIILKKNVAILGGGISGIATALFLQEMDPNLQVEIFEQSERLGGWINTLRGKYPFELGPRTLSYSRAGYFRRLLSILGLEEKIIMAKGPSKRYLLKGGLLLSLPPDLSSLLKNPAFYGSLFKAVLAELWIPVKEEDESIASFFSRRFGNKIGPSLAESITKGVFAGDCKTLSVTACFPKLKLLEKEGSLLKAIVTKKRDSSSKKGLFSLEGGLATFSETFRKRSQALIHTETEVTSFQKFQDGSEGYRLCGINSDGDSFEKRCDAIVSALPPKKLFQFLDCSFSKNDRGLHKKIEEKIKFLGELTSASLTLVLIGINQECKMKPGFGFLTLENGESPLLGCIFDSQLFPSGGLNDAQTRLTLMLQGIIPREEATKEALSILVNILQIETVPSFIQVHHCLECIPQYPLGHRERWDQLTHELEQQDCLFCVGTGGGGVSLEDCARKGFETAEKIAKRFREQRQGDELQSEEDRQKHTRDLLTMDSKDRSHPW